MLTLREKHEYEQEIAQLKLMLKRSTNGKTYYKRKYENLRSNKPTVRTNRTSRAKVYVEKYVNGDRSFSAKEIGAICFLSTKVIQNMIYRIRKSIKQQLVGAVNCNL